MEWVPYILLGIVILILLMLSFFWFGTHRLEGKPAPDLADIIGNCNDRYSKFLFYFYTPHCGPCRRMTLYIDELAEKHENIIKVDLSGNANIGRRFGVRVVPTILLIADGMVVKALVGEQPRQKLETLLLD